MGLAAGGHEHVRVCVCRWEGPTAAGEGQREEAVPVPNSNSL